MSYKQCRTEQSSSRQQALEQGLLEAMQTKHYDEITVSDLCTQMEIPRKTFYRYFSSKEGALHALIDQTLMEFTFLAENISWRDAQQMERIFAFWKRRKSLLDALERSNLSGVLIHRAVDCFLEESAASRRFFSQEEKRFQEHSIYFAVCGLMATVIQWHHDGYAESTQEMARMALRLLSTPLTQEWD